MELPVQNVQILTVQDLLAAAGAVVLDCRPRCSQCRWILVVWTYRRFGLQQCLPGWGLPLEREQLFGGGGGDLLGLICPELGVTPLVDPGTDVEDERPTPAALPVPAVHGVAPLPTQVDVDVELCRVIQDVGTLPEMVTLIGDPEGGACVDSGGVSCARDSRSVSGDGRTPGGDFAGWADRRGSSDAAVIDWVGGSVVGVSNVRWCPHQRGARRPGQLPWISVCLGLVRRSGGGGGVGGSPFASSCPDPSSDGFVSSRR